MSFLFLFMFTYSSSFIFFFFNDTATTEIYTLSLTRRSSDLVELTMETDFPEGETAKLALRLRAPREFTLALRRPYWTGQGFLDRKSTRLNSSHSQISYAVFCLKKKKKKIPLGERERHQRSTK